MTLVLNILVAMLAGSKKDTSYDDTTHNCQKQHCLKLTTNLNCGLFFNFVPNSMASMAGFEPTTLMLCDDPSTFMFCRCVLLRSFN